MANLFERRRKIGMSQFLCSQRAGISRMKLSLAETGQLTLSDEEQKALDRVLTEYLAAKAMEIAQLSKEQQAVAG
jgi:transcriptional regulator with XRE-family HTH domain